MPFLKDVSWDFLFALYTDNFLGDSPAFSNIGELWVEFATNELLSKDPI